MKLRSTYPQLSRKWMGIATIHRLIEVPAVLFVPYAIGIIQTQAFCADSDVILLDEPTTALDDERRELLKTLLDYTRKTVIMVTHDETFMGLADRVMTLQPAVELNQ